MHDRVEMWDELKLMGNSIQEPWLLSGDFNVVLSSEDRLGLFVTQLKVQDFRDCIGQLNFTPLNRKGYHYTFATNNNRSTRFFPMFIRNWVISTSCRIMELLKMIFSIQDYLVTRLFLSIILLKLSLDQNLLSYIKLY